MARAPMARASIGSASSLTSFRHIRQQLLHPSTSHPPPPPPQCPPCPNPPSIDVIGEARDSFLPALKTLTRPYDPYPQVAWNRHVETILAAFFRSLPDVRLRRECLRTKDGGAVALDWVFGDHRLLPSTEITAGVSYHRRP